MTEPPHRKRLAAACAAIDALAVHERTDAAVPPLRFVHEQDMRAGAYLVRAERSQPLPSETLDAIGLVVAELRMALDDLATALAGGAAVFPIFETLPHFAQRARKSLRGMSDEAQASIEALQPYHAIGGYRNGPLWVLDRLAAEQPVRLAAGRLRMPNGDPLSAAGSAPPPALGVNTRRKVELLGDPEIELGAFDAGAVVASQRFRIVGPDPKIDMFFRAGSALAFAAGGPARGRDVVDLLHELADHVRHTVLPVLEPQIPGA